MDAIGIFIFLLVMIGLGIFIYKNARKIDRQVNSIGEAEALEEMPNADGFTRWRELKNERIEIYDPLWLDFCAGCGWLPKYNYPVKVLPPIIELEQFIGAIDENDLGYQWKMQWEKDWSKQMERSPNYQKVEAGYYKSRFKQASKRTTQALYRMWLSSENHEEIGIDDYVCFQITPENGINFNEMHQFWFSLKGIENRLIYEIVSYKDKTAFQFLCHKQDENRVKSLLSAITDFEEDDLLPSIEEIAEYDEDIEARKTKQSLIGASFGLAVHYSDEIQIFKNFEHGDPLQSIIAMMEKMNTQKSGVVLQAMIEPSIGDWESQLNWLSQMDNILLPSFKDVVKNAKDKIKYPTLFGVKMQMVAFWKPDDEEDYENEKYDFTMQFKDALPSLFVWEGDNMLTIESPCEKASAAPSIFKNIDGIMEVDEMMDAFSRNTYRHGFVLNSQEMASLLHFPSKTLKSDKLIQKDRTIKVPEEYQQGEVLIGKQENGLNACIPKEWRARHTYVIGTTGSGKTTLLTNMIYQDIIQGRGVGVIDVKGGGKFIDELLELMPPERVDDVVLFDATDDEYPFCFNILDIKDNKEKNTMKQQLFFILKRATQANWTDPMETLFMEGVGAMINDDETHTLMDFNRLMFDDIYRTDLVNKITDSYSQSYWQDIYPSISDSTKMALSRRMADILSDVNSRNVLCQDKMSIDFLDIMNNSKIFLAKIPRGNFPVTYRFFASILMAKFEMTAMSRNTSVAFYLYIDEFQHFADETFEEVINEARDAGLHLIMSHQQTSQLNDKMMSAAMGTGSTIVFNVEPKDATRLSPFFKNFSPNDIMDLKEYETLTRIGRSSDAFRMNTLPPVSERHNLSNRIRQNCKEKYCVKLSDIPKPPPKEEKLYE